MTEHDQEVLHADLCELVVALGMGNYARPQSPHEVFQQALEVLRQKLSDAEFAQKSLKDIVAFCDREKGRRDPNVVDPRASAFADGALLIAGMVRGMARRGVA